LTGVAIVKGVLLATTVEHSNCFTHPQPCTCCVLVLTPFARACVGMQRYAAYQSSE
jgi:hypothetical protein